MKCLRGAREVLEGCQKGAGGVSEGFQRVLEGSQRGARGMPERRRGGIGVPDG